MNCYKVRKLAWDPFLLVCAFICFIISLPTGDKFGLLARPSITLALPQCACFFLLTTFSKILFGILGHWISLLKLKDVLFRRGSCVRPKSTDLCKSLLPILRVACWSYEVAMFGEDGMLKCTEFEFVTLYDIRLLLRPCIRFWWLMNVSLIKNEGLLAYSLCLWFWAVRLRISRLNSSGCWDLYCILFSVVFGSGSWTLVSISFDLLIENFLFDEFLVVVPIGFGHCPSSNLLMLE